MQHQAKDKPKMTKTNDRVIPATNAIQTLTIVKKDGCSFFVLKANMNALNIFQFCFQVHR